MRLSPILGLPIAEQDDARRDFPLTVDDPRTMAIEAALTETPFARVAWAGMSLPVGDTIYASAPTSIDAMHCTVNAADGTVTIETPGRYLVVGTTNAYAAAQYHTGTKIGVDGALQPAWGSAASDGTVIVAAIPTQSSLILTLTAGQTVNLAVYCSLAGDSNSGQLDIIHIGLSN